MTELRPVADDDVRVGDAERRTVDERLRAAVGEGLLTLDEYDERAVAVWAARTRGALRVLTADLPAPRSGPPAPPSAHRSRHRRRWCWGLAAAGVVALLAVPGGGAVVTTAGPPVSLTVEGPPPPVPLEARVEERTEVVQPGETVHVVAPGAEETTVVVPDGVRAVPEVAPGPREVECDDACEVVSDQTVRVVVGEGVGDVDIETASERD